MIAFNSILKYNQHNQTLVNGYDESKESALQISWERESLSW